MGLKDKDSSFLKRVRAFIREKELCLPTDRILVAVSGGIDSMVLAHTLGMLEYTIGVVHCNFGLRGEEADADTDFVNHHFSARNIPVFIKRFDTATFAQANRYSIQEAARILRYDFFNEVLTQEGYDYVAVAHHLNDASETTLHGLLRSKHWEVLPRLAPKVEDRKVIRPLLCVNKDEIRHQAERFRIPFREDRSNQKDDYERNYIRLTLSPYLQTVNPRWDAQLLELTERYHHQLTLLRPMMESETQKRVLRTDEGMKISIEGFEKTENEALLHEWIYYLTDKVLHLERSYAERILSLISSPAGKKILHTQGVMTRERDHLYFEFTPTVPKIPDPPRILTLSDGWHEWNGIQYRLHTALPKKMYVYQECFTERFDAEKIKGQITLRTWQAGDRMQPIGSSGEKKIKDLLNDVKFTTRTKKEAYVLCDEEKIIYAQGCRISEQVKVTPETKALYYWLWMPKNV